MGKKYIVSWLLSTFSAIFMMYSIAVAADKVVVIPLNSAKKLKNVITVSPQGGDFTDPVAAVSSISDASSSNRYLVMIGPGEYTLTQPLVMKPYVDVKGSGRGTTKLTGSISSSSIGNSSAIIVGSTYTWLSDLSIRNSGGGDYSIGIYNSGATYDITQVDVEAWGSIKCQDGTCGNYGIYNSNYSSTRISDTKLYGGGTYAYGVYNNQSSPTLNRVELDAWVDEGLNCCGAFGISSSNSSNPSVRYSTLRGSSYGLQQNGGSVRVSYSTIVNLIDTGGSPDVKCIYSDNGEGSRLDVDCYGLLPAP